MEGIYAYVVGFFLTVFLATIRYRKENWNDAPWALLVVACGVIWPLSLCIFGARNYGEHLNAKQAVLKLKREEEVKLLEESGL